MDCGNKVPARHYIIEFASPCPRFAGSHLKDIIPENTCPILLHTLVPYYITFSRGGDFTWSENKGHVDVRCPNPKGSVSGDTAREGSVDFAVGALGEACPMNYKIGFRIPLSSIFEKLCPSVYDVAYPWIQLGILGPIKLRCPSCSECGGAEFILQKRI